MRVRVILGVALVLAPGCGSQKFAPVSGRVTLNGEPLANAFVTFNPIPKAASIEGGPTAVGMTDQDGRFSLRVSLDQNGALVGKHRVAITVVNAQAGNTDARVGRKGRPLTSAIPSRYNDQSDLTFEVPSGGTDQANFELQSP
jgi:hypothetical protein